MEDGGEDERMNLSSTTTSKSLRPTLRPTQTMGNSPLPPSPGMCPGRPGDRTVPRSAAGGPSPPPRGRWLAGCSVSVGPCSPPSYSLPPGRWEQSHGPCRFKGQDEEQK